MSNWKNILNVHGMGLNLNSISSVQDIEDKASASVQRRYPGPYTVESFYDSTKGKFSLRLKFKDTREEIMWLLRWS